MATKINLEGLLPIMLLYPFVTWSMTIKIGRGVTYYVGAPPIKSHSPWTTWSCEITRQTKIIMSPLPQRLWPQIFGRMVTYLEQLLAIKSHDHIITWSCEITWQTKIVVYPLPQNVCDYQTWQGGDIQRGGSFHKLTRSFDHVVLQGHVNIRQIKNIKSDLSQYLFLPNLSERWFTVRSSQP